MELRRLTVLFFAFTVCLLFAWPLTHQPRPFAIVTPAGTTYLWIWDTQKVQPINLIDLAKNYLSTVLPRAPASQTSGLNALAVPAAAGAAFPFSSNGDQNENGVPPSQIAVSTSPMLLLRTLTVSDEYPNGMITAHQEGVVERVEVGQGVQGYEVLYFRVQGRPLINLKRRTSTYMHKIKMMVETKVIDMGSYPLDDEEHSFRFPDSKVPSMPLLRGDYRTTFEFFDDVGPVCPPLVKELTLVKANK